jgi:hypothetical protein
MVKLSVFNKRWRISENNRTILSGIGSTSQAIAIAKRYGFVLSELKHIDYLKAA